jgi:hypothetical protein
LAFLLFYLPALFLWLGIPRLCWNNSGKGRHTCLIPDVRRNGLIISSFSMMSAIDL